MKKSFVATLKRTQRNSEACILEIPFDVKAAFGKARAPVLCTLNGKTSWRTTVAVYGGQSLIGLRQEIREQAALEEGAKVKVTLEADDAPRVVQVPADLKKALKGTRAVAWKKYSFSHQNEWVKALEDAKRPETRARRIAELVEVLSRKLAE